MWITRSNLSLNGFWWEVKIGWHLKLALSSLDNCFIIFWSFFSRQIGPVKEYIKMLCENKDLKFIVFAFHRQMLDGITEQFIDSSVKFIRIDGSTVGHDRPVSWKPFIFYLFFIFQTFVYFCFYIFIYFYICFICLFSITATDFAISKRYHDKSCSSQYQSCRCGT